MSEKINFYDYNDSISARKFKRKVRRCEMKRYDARERLEKIKKLSGELREIALKKYPDMIEEEVDFITSYLGKELKFFFKPFDKEIRKMQDEEKELLDK